MKTTRFYLLLIAVVSTAFVITSSANGQAQQKDVEIKKIEKEGGVIQLKIAGVGYLYGAHFSRNTSSSTECYISIDDGTDYDWTCSAGTCILQGYNWTIIDYYTWGMSEVEVACTYYDANGEKQRAIRRFPVE